MYVEDCYIMMVDLCWTDCWISQCGLNSIIDPRQSFATDDFNILRKIFNKQAFTGPAVILFILPFVLVIYTIYFLFFTDVIISAIIVILVIIGLRFYHRRDKSKVSNTAMQFVKFMRCLRCKYSAKKPNTDENMKLKTEDYYMYRGTSSNDLNSIQDTSESGETITWTNVGEEADIFFGFLISIFLISVHILYVVDATVGLH